MSVHLEKVIQPNNILDWFFDCQSSNGLTVFETFLSQGIISLIFFKKDFLAQTVIYISPIETLPKRLQSLGEKQHTTLKARFIANILSLSGTGNLNRLITVWWCIYTAHAELTESNASVDAFARNLSLTYLVPRGLSRISISYRVLSSGRSRGADLLSILSDTSAYPNPSHKPAGIYEFITWRGESGEEPENNPNKNYEELVNTGAPNDGFLLNAMKSF